MAGRTPATFSRPGREADNLARIVGAPYGTSIFRAGCPYMPQINDRACRAIDLYETGVASDPVRRQSPFADQVTMFVVKPLRRADPARNRLQKQPPKDRLDFGLFFLHFVAVLAPPQSGPSSNRWL